MLPLNFRAAFGVNSQPAPQMGDPLTTLLPIIRANRTADINQELANKIKLMQAQADIEGKNKPQQQMNVTAGMTPYEQARIALMGAQEKGKTTRETAALETKKEIAGQTETGRGERAQLRSDTQKSISSDRLKAAADKLGLDKSKFEFYKNIHDMSDSDREKALANRQITMEDLRNVHRMEQIDEQGVQSISGIQERGKQQRQTQASKGLTPGQQGAQYENKARQLLSQHPEYKDYIKFNPDNNKFMQIENGGDSNIYHEINRQIYGNDQPGTIDLPKDTGEPQTYNKGDDPLNLFNGNSDTGTGSDSGDEAA